MNWYKKAQKNITIDDIYWAMDDIWLNDIFTEEDITNILDQNLNSIIQAKEGNQEYQSKAAQVAVPIRSKRKSKIPEFDYKKTKKQVIDEVKKQKQGLDLSLRISSQSIADKIKTHPKVVDTILKQNNINLNEAMAKRRKYAENIIIDFVSTLPDDIPTMKVAYSLFTNKYKHNIKIKKFNLILTYNNKLRNWGYKSNIIFDAFNKYIANNYTNSRQSVDDLIANGKYLTILDKFLDQYAHQFGFKSPMDIKMVKEFFMTKIQLRDRIKEYRQLGKFYNQHVDSNTHKNIISLIEQGLNPQDIAKQTGINIKQIEKFYRIYQLRHSPMVTDETHPSYFLNNPES